MPPTTLLVAAISAVVIALPGVAAAQARRPAPVTLDAAGSLGGLVRVSDSQRLDVTERAGLSFGAGLAVSPAPMFAIGLAYEHADLGQEQSGQGPLGSITVERDLNSLWASIRVFLVPHGDVRPFLGIAAGLAWQSADASGTATFGPDPSSIEPFRCEGRAGASVAFGVAAGVEARLAGQLFLTGDLAFQGYGLSSDPLDDGLTLCAPGAGTVNAFALRAGLAYRWDITRVMR